MFGNGEAPLHGTLAAELSQGGACQDQTRLHAASVNLETRAGRLLVSLSPLSSQAADPLRTRCPGPELGQHAFTRGTLARTALRRRVLTVALHGAFAAFVKAAQRRFSRPGARRTARTLRPAGR